MRPQISYFPDLVHPYILLPTAWRIKPEEDPEDLRRPRGDEMLHFTDFPKVVEQREPSAVEERLTASCRRIFLYFIQSKIPLKLLQVTLLWKAKDKIIESYFAE